MGSDLARGGKLVCIAFLALGVGCSAPRADSSTGAHDAASDVDASVLPEAGLDAAIDVGANADVQDPHADGQWMPGCTVGIDGGALGAAEAIATGRPEASYVGASGDGPVWTEAKYFVDANGVTERGAAIAWLPTGQTAPQFPFVDELCEEDVAEFQAYNHHVAVVLWPSKAYCGGSPLLMWSRTDGEGKQYYGALPLFALDDSHVYLVDSPCELRRIALDSDAGAGPSPETAPWDCVALTVATDGASIFTQTRNAENHLVIESISHWGDAPHVLAEDAPGPASHMGFQADDGAVFWQVDKTSRIYELPAGSSTPRLLVDDPDGVWGFTVDHDYVYWASGEGWKAAQGTIKRIRRCGGAPEVIAQGQRWSAEYRDPVGISVGADALYWVTGDGNIMRIRKLDAPDAGVDATGDASVNVSSDAGFDASIDAGVE